MKAQIKDLHENHVHNGNLIRMENIKNIGFELAYGTRKSKVNLIISLSGEEFETRGDLIELATKTDEEINYMLYDLIEYFINEIENYLEN